MQDVHQNRNRSHAFTLIELLVVLSVIALLIGILLPTLSVASAAARATAAMSNMRGIGQGMEVYLHNYDGHYFPNHPPEGEGDMTVELIEWHKRLAAGVTQFDPRTMINPLDPHKNIMLDHDGEPEPMASFSINGYFEVVGARQYYMRSPNDTIILANRADTDDQGDPLEDGMDAQDVHLAFHPWEDEPWWDHVTTDRAEGKASYLFADGHALRLREDELTEAMGEPGEAFRPAEPDN